MKAVKVYLDGAPAGQIPVGVTGGWAVYKDFTGAAPISFPAGRHVVTIAFEGISRVNLDRLAFSAISPTVTTPTPAPTTVVPTTVNTPPPVVIPSSTPTTVTPTATPTVAVTQNTTLAALPGASNPPRDSNGDGRYEDVNGNGRTDFNDVTVLFNGLSAVASAYPVQAFDFNTNARVDYGDVTVLYSKL